MVLLLVFALLFVNLGISFFNAYVAGKAWVETKHAGGWRRIMVWLTAGMSGLGFSWCYLIIAVIVGTAVGWLEEDAAEAALSLGYLVIVPGVLFIGPIFMINSWANAYRKRTFANVGVAGWNTFANVYNYYNAIRGIPQALDVVLEFFKGGGNSKAKGQAAVLLLVILALVSGFITTGVIINRVAASDDPMPAPGYAT